MRKLEGSDPPFFQKNLKACNKVVDIRHMSQDIIGDDKVRSAALLPQAPRGLRAEKRDLGRNLPEVPGRPCTIRGWVNTETGNATLHEILQQIAIVAGDLDYARRRIKRKALHRLIDELACMPEPAFGHRRKIDILAVEMRFRPLEIIELDQPAGITDETSQWIEFLAERCLVGANERIRNRRHAKIHENRGQWRAARAAR